MNQEQGKELHLTDAEFDKAVKQSGVVLVDFFAPWCGPCRTMGPIIEELAQEYAGKAHIYKMNIDENSQAPNKHAVRSIPTLIVFKDGTPVERLVGAVSKAMLKEKLDIHLTV